MKYQSTLSALVAAAMLASATGHAVAENYRASTGTPDSETNTVMMKWFAEELAKETQGEIAFEVFSGGVLMPNNAHLTGIGDGVAQMGLHISGYTPSQLPTPNALQGFGFVESDPITISFAFADFLMHDAALNQEFRAHRVVPLGAFAGGTYALVCNTSEPITELEQLKGLKVRSFGLIGNLLTSLGATPVNIPSTEAYQALQVGQVDCSAIFPSYLNVEDKLDEVAKSTTLTNWSPAFTAAMHVYNEDFWQGLTTEQRQTILGLAARTQAKIQVRFHELNQKALDDAKAKGHVVVEPAESLKAAVAEWVADGVGDMAGTAKSTFGIADPQALFTRFEPYIEKWRGLVGGMADKYDENALAKLLLDQMYGDLDPATYGMN